MSIRLALADAAANCERGGGDWATVVVDEIAAVASRRRMDDAPRRWGY